MDIITACDIRFCSKDAVFSVKEVDVGLAADVGTLQRLPKIVGNQSWVREVCYTARNFNASEAEVFGLVSKVYGDRRSLLDGALELAAVIAEKAPLATLGTKHILNHARDHTVQE
jgi:delta(3,5)-delta(2,4)-dienoyl-CoA isomerase